VNIQSTPDDPRLLVTSTKEPFQPVRIYYSIPDKPFIIRVFNGFRCVGLEAGGRAWDWLYPLADVIHEVINTGVQNGTIQDIPWPDE